MAMAEALVPLAEGFEEMEAVILVDVLRRAGVAVTTFGLKGKRVAGSRGIVLEADAVNPSLLVRDWDLVLLPGGMPGSLNLADDVRILALLKRQAERGLAVGAICAAPLALDLVLFMDLAGRAGMGGTQEWLSFFFKSPMHAPEVYAENDLFVQLEKFENNLRHMMGETLITHLGTEYYK